MNVESEPLFHQPTNLHFEEYGAYTLPQSEAPLKYILSGPRSGNLTDYATRTFHILGQEDVDRPQLTNRNELLNYNVELAGRNPLRTRHIFGEESQYESFLRPISSGQGVFEASVDRFHPALLQVEQPVDYLGVLRSSSSTRADLRNQFRNLD